jgi:hypothetical protein
VNTEKTRELVGNLTKRTELGDYIWEPLGYQKGYQTKIDALTMRIRTFDGPLLEGAQVELDILNSRGTVISTITERDITGGTLPQFSTPFVGGMLSLLWNAIVGSSDEADEAMDKLLKATKLR